MSVTDSGIAVGARQFSLTVSETTDLLRFSHTHTHTTDSRVSRV